MVNMKILKNEKGFTLIEVIAVLVILGILGAVAVPKYMDITNEARTKAAYGQINEVKGRLALALANEMIKNSGAVPASGAALVGIANTLKAGSCPDPAIVEGDFKYGCTGNAGAKTVSITVSEVQGKTLTAPVTDVYDFTNAG